MEAAASEFRVEMKIISASELKNVNWRGGRQLRPFAAVWVAGEGKQYTYAATYDVGGLYSWNNQILYLPFSTHAEGATLHIHLFHQSNLNDDAETKHFIGSTEINLDDEGVHRDGHWRNLRTYDLNTRKGRPHGKINLRIRICELGPSKTPDVEGEHYPIEVIM